MAHSFSLYFRLLVLLLCVACQSEDQSSETENQQMIDDQANISKRRLGEVAYRLTRVAQQMDSVGQARMDLLSSPEPIHRDTLMAQLHQLDTFIIQSQSEIQESTYLLAKNQEENERLMIMVTEIKQTLEAKQTELAEIKERVANAEEDTFIPSSEVFPDLFSSIRDEISAKLELELSLQIARLTREIERLTDSLNESKKTIQQQERQLAALRRRSYRDTSSLASARGGSRTYTDAEVQEIRDKYEQRIAALSGQNREDQANAYYRIGKEVELSIPKNKFANKKKRQARAQYAIEQYQEALKHDPNHLQARNRIASLKAEHKL